MVLVSVADPVSGAISTPGSGMGNKSRSGIGIREEHPGSYFRELRNNFMEILICGSGIRNLFDLESGMEKILIRDKHPGSATVVLVFIDKFPGPIKLFPMNPYEP